MLYEPAKLKSAVVIVIAAVDIVAKADVFATSLDSILATKLA